MTKVYCDGGSRGNPGPSAYGFVVEQDNQTIHREGGYLGIETNNYAEYTALIKALAWLKNAKITGEISAFLDSKLVVSQLTGLYKVKNSKIRSLVFAVRQLEPDFKRINYQHIPREQNKHADLEVNRALDNQKWS